MRRCDMSLLTLAWLCCSTHWADAKAIRSEPLHRHDELTAAAGSNQADASGGKDAADDYDPDPVLGHKGESSRHGGDAPSSDNIALWRAQLFGKEKASQATFPTQACTGELLVEDYTSEVNNQSVDGCWVHSRSGAETCRKAVVHRGVPEAGHCYACYYFKLPILVTSMSGAEKIPGTSPDICISATMPCICGEQMRRMILASKRLSPDTYQEPQPGPAEDLDAQRAAAQAELKNREKNAEAEARQGAAKKNVAKSPSSLASNAALGSASRLPGSDLASPTAAQNHAAVLGGPESMSGNLSAEAPERADAPRSAEHVPNSTATTGALAHPGDESDRPDTVAADNTSSVVAEAEVRQAASSAEVSNSSNASLSDEARRNSSSEQEGPDDRPGRLGSVAIHRLNQQVGITPAGGVDLLKKP
eukprot:TRINITY_DN22383_c0_g1_i2.p1 TRINITY_DN22383_c0_g1~~TRINITY_DN22383_c0_g1_i2.p1  ORF type:complete len:419 (-),score=97.58 TRINITY_DN22383_c0_g1_i2:43-1299(-)